VTEDGTILRHLCREVWTKRRLIEDDLQREDAQPLPSSAVMTNRVHTRNENVVLLGHRKALRFHVGNIRLRKLVAEMLSVYDSAHHAEKQHISDYIVRMVRERGGRFFKEYDSCWMGVEVETARSKVSNHHSRCCGPSHSGLGWIVEEELNIIRALFRLLRCSSRSCENSNVTRPRR